VLAGTDTVPYGVMLKDPPANVLHLLRSWTKRFDLD
jgi:hypothetical protein